MTEELHTTKKHGILSASLQDKERFSSDKEGRAFVYLFVVHLVGMADPFRVLKKKQLKNV